jgi:hypothetical protein
MPSFGAQIGAYKSISNYDNTLTTENNSTCTNLKQEHCLAKTHQMTSRWIKSKNWQHSGEESEIFPIHHMIIIILAAHSMHQKLSNQFKMKPHESESDDIVFAIYKIRIVNMKNSRISWFI